MTPEEFRAAFIKSRGLNLDGAPTEPYRMPPQEAVDAWRNGVKSDANLGIIPTPGAVPPPMPLATPAVSYAPRGVSLASNPVTPGWQNTAGVAPAGSAIAPPEAAAAPSSDFNLKSIFGNKDTMDALGSIAKAVDRRPVDPSATQITPMSNTGGNIGGGGGGNAAQLMAAMLQNSRRNYGMSLMGMPQ